MREYIIFYENISVKFQGKSQYFSPDQKVVLKKCQFHYQANPCRVNEGTILLFTSYMHRQVT